MMEMKQSPSNVSINQVVSVRVHVQVCHVTYLSVCIMSSSTFVCMYLCEVQAVVFLHSHVNNNVMIFLDVCQQCGHVIADHEYTFSVDDQYQVFTILVLTMQ